MRPTPTVLRLAACLTAFAPLASAWPNWLPEIDSLVVRQNDENSESADPTAEATMTEPPEASATDEEGDSYNTARPTSDNGDDEETGTETGTRTGTRDPDNTEETTRKPTKTSIGVHDYPGGIQMLTPDTTAADTNLFKIGEYVTLAWNFTSVKATPTAIDVILSCSAKSETWTLTANMTYETEINYVWNTDDQADDAENPLGTDMYTLVIKDSAAEISDRPSPGYLAAVSDFKFGLYTPAPYVDWPEWECVGCSAARPTFDTQVVKLALTMTFVTIMSISWFFTGL